MSHSKGPSPTPPSSASAVTFLRRAVPVLLAVALAATLARAIQTQEVELGNGGAYDGAVKIGRDTQGRLTFGDSQVMPAVTLNDLRYAGRDHGLLLGLGDDDHPQYLNAARHTSAHTASANGALAIPADVRGNATLGAHLTDSQIHLSRSAAETVAGNWLFSGAPSFAGIPAFQAGLNIAAGPLRIGGIDALTNSRAASLTLADIDNLRLDGNYILSLDPDGNIYLNPNGAGQVMALKPVCGLGLSYDADTYPADPAKSEFTLFNWGANNWAGLGGTTNGGCWMRSTVFKLWSPPFSTTVPAMSVSGGCLGVGGVNLPLAALHAAGDATLTGGLYTGGSATAKGTLRLSADGAATLTQADVDNLRLDGNTLSSTNGGGDINLAPNGAGKVAVAGDLAVGAGGGKLTLNGQRFMNEVNLLDNPDFTVWQRNLSQRCAAGGNAAGTLTWPVPGTLGTGADRWQISRAKTDMASTVTRALPPSPLPTAPYCLKNELQAGATVNQYIHQTLPRELTAGLRGKWVTFAISHYIAGTSGGTIGIYKVTGGTPTALATYAFTSVANTWERVALAAQVPSDAEVLLVSVCSNLAAAGPGAAYLANAALVEGKYVAAGEKVSDPALSSVPPLPRPPGENLAACQRYFEKGALAFTSYAPDTALTYHYTTVHYNAAKASSPAIALSNTNYAGLVPPIVSTEDAPAYSAGQSWPQGFRFSAGGMALQPMSLPLSADWTATCPEPI